jgi:hypothetical protein
VIHLDGLDAKKDVLMPAVWTSRGKIFIFEFIYCTNVPPYSRDAATLLTLATSESQKEARHYPGDSLSNRRWMQGRALDCSGLSRSSVTEAR